jgi:hypothetical protein
MDGAGFKLSGRRRGFVPDTFPARATGHEKASLSRGIVVIATTHGPKRTRTQGRTGNPWTPIRRFSDIICHRALLREIGAADDPLPEHLGDLAEHVSAREREAAELEYLADDICLAWLLERLLFERGWDESFEGEITG